MALQTIDKTKGKRPKSSEEFKLEAESDSGSKYSYYGSTKKEALSKFKKKFGTFRGFVKKKFTIEEK